MSVQGTAVVNAAGRVQLQLDWQPLVQDPGAVVAAGPAAQAAEGAADAREIRPPTGRDVAQRVAEGQYPNVAPCKAIMTQSAFGAQANSIQRQLDLQTGRNGQWTVAADERLAAWLAVPKRVRTQVCDDHAPLALEDAPATGDQGDPMDQDPADAETSSSDSSSESFSGSDDHDSTGDVGSQDGDNTGMPNNEMDGKAASDNVKEVATRLEELEDALCAARKAFHEPEERNTALQTRVGELEDELGATDEAFQESEQRHTALQEEVNTLKAQLAL